MLKPRITFPADTPSVRDCLIICLTFIVINRNKKKVANECLCLKQKRRGYVLWSPPLPFFLLLSFLHSNTRFISWPQKIIKFRASHFLYISANGSMWSIQEIKFWYSFTSISVGIPPMAIAMLSFRVRIVSTLPQYIFFLIVLPNIA